MCRGESLPIVPGSAEMHAATGEIIDRPASTMTPKRNPATQEPPRHHNVYVIFLRNPRGDGKAGYYVGMTGLTPEERFKNHLAGIKSARVVRKYGVRLVPKLYEHLNPMSYDEAARMETQLAEDLRRRGFQVFGGH